jgi:hypothetical protein
MTGRARWFPLKERIWIDRGPNRGRERLKAEVKNSEGLKDQNNRGRKALLGKLKSQSNHGDTEGYGGLRRAAEGSRTASVWK